MKNLKDFREQWERTNQKVRNGYTLAAVHHPLNASICVYLVNIKLKS